MAVINSVAEQHAREVSAGRRFRFVETGRVPERLNLARIVEARTTSRNSRRGSLSGKTFLDIGSGSGLSSLAAYRLGAAVVSFDFDGESVACTEELRRRYSPCDQSWIVGQGSVSTRNILAGLGQFDIVYSWGVLHHTGAMWQR